MAQPLSASVVSTSAKRFSPGAKDFMKCFRICRPSAKIFKTNLSPTWVIDSIARSLATATVKPGGLNVACDTQEANIALSASPFLVVITQREPKIRPTACSVRAAWDSPTAWRMGRIFLARFNVWAKSVPASSHICSVASVGLNLTRIVSKPSL